LDDDRLEALLFPPLSQIPVELRPVPDWVWVHRELRRPNVTLALLWEEHRAAAPDGFGYSWFCDLYREWAGRLKPTLRQVHTAGEQLFVDYAGSTMAVMAGASGEERQAAIFVAVLGASSFTFACATWSQALPDWLGAGAAGSRRTASAGGKGRRCAPPSGRTCGRSATSAVSRASWSATTSRRASPVPASMSLG
jgi:transposase